MIRLLKARYFRPSALAVTGFLLLAGSWALLGQSSSDRTALQDSSRSLPIDPKEGSQPAPILEAGSDVMSSSTAPMRRRSGLVATIADFFDIVIKGGQPERPDRYLGQPAAVPISSDNVEFVANFPVPAAIGGRFQKRITPAGPRTYFFATGLRGLQIFDATNPRLPIQVGAFELPHYENEDVDLSGNTLLISGDGSWNSELYIIDITVPQSPRFRGSIKWANDPARWGNRRPGHTASCIQDCRYAWVAGGRGKDIGESGWIAVVDLTQDQPRFITAFQPRAGNPNAKFTRGTIHDVNVDSAGLVWITGSGGVSAVSIGGPLGGTPVSPVPIAHNDAIGLNRFILHNSIRASQDLLLVTEEDWEHILGIGTGAPQEARKPNSCTDYQGRFETFRFDETSQTITPIAQFKPEYIEPSQLNGRSPVQVLCSSHWFDYRADGLVATGWYNQGVRFLDVTDPSKIAQVGWWLPPGATVWASYFHPDDPSIVYVADNARGLDVIHKCEDRCPSGGAISTQAPTVAVTRTSLSPSPVWGYACPVVRIDEPGFTGPPVRRD